ncbi:RNA polymerase sigma-70 factor [Prevotella sp. A2931]|uniref:RNA polymerase sigma-70 factor n=1 Tax=Prevotella illustrans TaxID=2800387 RepID=A0ABS3M267_9BACT|nr:MULTISPECIES: RNA polymerase sigma-70 factor [Prevotella]MBO1362195.1 RNA polymerase sigma-70 factor [Prevotella illustrans]PTL26531.1 RNA polymerase sigma-70 factor [Prevotella sp. oral taxon 820]
MQIAEEKLIEALSQDSHEAFDLIYNMYAKRLYAYCMQYSKTTEDTEDILQGVFCKLWVNRRHIKKRQSLKSLLFTIAHHAVIDTYRRRLLSPTYREYVEYKAASETDSSTRIEYEEFVNRLNAILKSMSETQRNVIQRAKFQGMRNADIAAELHLSEQTVKNALSAGMKTLRDKLASITILLLQSLLLIINK